MRALVLLLALGGGACGKREQAAPVEPPAPSSPVAALSEITTIDWANRPYDLLALGTVKVANRIAEFRLAEDDEGSLRADQATGETSEGTGKLVLAAPTYVDVDGDKHDEAMIQFELTSSIPDQVPHLYGVFVYTLRAGNPELLDTVSTPTKIVTQGARVDSVDGVHHWAWNAAAHAYAGS